MERLRLGLSSHVWPRWKPGNGVGSHQLASARQTPRRSSSHLEACLLQTAIANDIEKGIAERLLTGMSKRNVGGMQCALDSAFLSGPSLEHHLSIHCHKIATTYFAPLMPRDEA